MKESDNTTIFSNATNEELLANLREIHSMSSSDIVLLKQEFINREMFEESFAIDTFFSDQFDPSTLSLKEIQALVSDRLQTGESIESIKLDLADHGITLAELIENEGKRIDAVFEKIASAPEQGINNQALNNALKDEYKYTDKELLEVKANLKKRSIVYRIAGVSFTCLCLLLLLVGLYIGTNIFAILANIGGAFTGIMFYKKGVRLAGK